MAQETRKDPRAKVLTVTVRYKSATLDEFIEHHSHDVSRGGMFIKTVSPFPPGTLLKIEVRIAGDQRVMQGVGRVVWKRESGEQTDGNPAGMGVKFIKIDDASRGVIDQLVAKSGGAVSAFDKGGGDKPAVNPSASPPATETPTAAKAVRKQTMIGLGAMDQAKDEPEKERADEKADAPFFPTGDGAPEQPAPEDRTVMKQAAELLQDALREAGGSLDEVGTPGTGSHPPPPVYDPPRPAKSDEPGKPGVSVPPTSAKDESKPPEAKAETKPTPSEKPPVSAKPASSAKGAVAAAKPATTSAKAAGTTGSPRPSQRPPGAATTASRRAPVAAQPAQQDSGNGRTLVIVLALVAVVGGIFMLTRKSDEPATPAPSEVNADTPPAAPPPAETMTAPEPTPPTALSALPAESAAPLASAPPTPAPEAPAVPTEAKKVKPAPVKPALPKAPVVVPVKPATPEPPTASEPKAPAEPVAPETKPAAPAPSPTPTEAKPPAEPKPAAEPKPPAEPKPAPAPKPKQPSSDNPF